MCFRVPIERQDTSTEIEFYLIIEQFQKKNLHNYHHFSSKTFLGVSGNQTLI